MTGFVLNMTGCVPNMNGPVIYMTGFVLNRDLISPKYNICLKYYLMHDIYMTGFVQSLTGYVLNITKCFLKYD